VQADPEPAKPATAPSRGPSVAVAPSAEVAGLLKRARELIEVGDIGAARLLLERAAATNSGTALFALAVTYDPAMLTRWRVQGVRPNVDRARSLYQKALDQGVGEAQERLAVLR
jgi:TPR repeat protein